MKKQKGLIFIDGKLSGKMKVEDQAKIFFKGVSFIREKIYKALRKKYRLSEKQLELNIKEIYSDILERFVKDETERLKRSKAKLIEFDLSNDKLNKYINNAVNSLKFFPVKSDSNISEKRISENERIKNMVAEKQKENPNKSLSDIYFEIATETEKTTEDIKRLHYYQPKK